MYHRVLLKLSGEALSAGKDGILNDAFIREIGQALLECQALGAQISIVVGGGNIWRGRQGTRMDRTRADHMGMLATAINCLGLQDTFEQMGMDVRVMTAVEMKQFAEPYIRNKAISHLNKGRVVIFGCGIGSPFFSTDTAAVFARGGNRSGCRTYGKKCGRRLYSRSENQSGSSEIAIYRL